jgi:hypothetical protein
LRVHYSFQAGNAVGRGELVLPKSSRPDFHSCAVFAFAKAGSVLVNRIASDLMQIVGVPVVDWAALWYEKGIETWAFQADLAVAFPSYGYCFAGFREIPRSFLAAPAIKALRKTLIVRDPRDMLVSRYFSTKYSHGFEPRGTPQFATLIRHLIDDGRMDIDAYCLYYSWIINADFFTYREIIGDVNTKVLRYEDFVYDKRVLVRGLCDWFGLDIETSAIDEIVTRYVAIPERESPDQHVRQAHPGDFRRKLQRETIEALNLTLANYMTTFGYEP